MFSDICIPKGNEEDFILTAGQLGIKKLFFLYDFSQYDEDKIKKKLESIVNKKIDIETGLIVGQGNITVKLG